MKRNITTALLIIASLVIGYLVRGNIEQSEALRNYENKAIADTLAAKLNRAEGRYLRTMEALEQAAVSGKAVTFTAKDKSNYDIILKERAVK